MWCAGAAMVNTEKWEYETPKPSADFRPGVVRTMGHENLLTCPACDGNVRGNYPHASQTDSRLWRGLSRHIYARNDLAAGWIQRCSNHSRGRPGSSTARDIF